MKKWLVAVTMAAGFAALYGNAWAAPLNLAEIQAKNRQTHKYTCATGKILQVTYWNTANGQSFALVPVKGQQLLFVNTISASGAKYQAGSYTASPSIAEHDAASFFKDAACLTLRLLLPCGAARLRASFPFE
jgi:membrane-bound inhibitor of C-type lysozyme